MNSARRPSPRPTPPTSEPGLPPEIVAVLRRTAEETMRRHQPTDDGRCSYCSMTWLHTDTMHPCPPWRIAAEFRALTE
ncbi:MAG: hypothetical protein ACRDTM_08910 [Micromonosporaceae bacterium]